MLWLNAVAGQVVSTQAISSQIDHYVDAFASHRDFSGIVWVRQDDHTLYRKLFGYANFEWLTPMTDRTVFRIASLTKTFTAGAIYLLERRGQLSFADKLSKFLPDFPKADKITIEQLLSHSSGVGAPNMEPYSHDDSLSIDKAISLVAAEPFQFEPGTSDQYSNSGYTILAKIVGMVSGKPYGEFLSDEFFKPLGMTATGNFTTTEIVPFRSCGYLPGPPAAGVSPAEGYEELPYLGAGSLWSIADDLGRWLDAVEANRFFNIDKLNWPMGWGKRQYFNLRATEQTGLSAGFASGIIFFPSKKLQVIVLSNIQTPFAGQAGKDIAGIVLNQPLAARILPVAVHLDPPDGERIVGRYSPGGKDWIDIVGRRSGLYYRWDGNGDFRYLVPTGSNSLYVRDEFAKWTWQDKDTFLWEGPTGSFQMHRVKT